MTDDNEGFDLVNDRGFERELDQLKVTRVEKQNNCEWIRYLKDYRKHLDKSYSNNICQYCGGNFLALIAPHKHIKDDCLKVPVTCPLHDEYGCSDHIVREDFEKHLLTEQQQAALVSSIEEMEKFTEKLTILDQGIKTLMSNTARIASEIQRNEHIIQSVFSAIQPLKLSIDEKDSFLARVSQNQQIIQEELTKTKEDLQNIEHTFYDGMFTWKITNVSDKMADAQSERQTSIYYPPDLTSKMSKNRSMEYAAQRNNLNKKWKNVPKHFRSRTRALKHH
ncbi:unnamed protein product [Didymodactylos carnosus]|uniref:Uncharacterized protein n=1 Tax=Didymodactylos carnosus TaxID=1234261 RepID=A0A8S2D3T8_9BILA|nr:unnamed protein product [Didymodactylos carnosus]CAF3616133.1 unnamed protein product [Didymodactylos carnosus]